MRIPSLRFFLWQMEGRGPVRLPFHPMGRPFGWLREGRSVALDAWTENGRTFERRSETTGLNLSRLCFSPIQNDPNVMPPWHKRAAARSPARIDGRRGFIDFESLVKVASRRPH